MAFTFMIIFLIIPIVATLTTAIIGSAIRSSKGEKS